METRSLVHAMKHNLAMQFACLLLVASTVVGDVMAAPPIRKWSFKDFSWLLDRFKKKSPPDKNSGFSVPHGGGTKVQLPPPAAHTPSADEQARQKALNDARAFVASPIAEARGVARHYSGRPLIAKLAQVIRQHLTEINAHDFAVLHDYCGDGDLRQCLRMTPPDELRAKLNASGVMTSFFVRQDTVLGQTKFNGATLTSTYAFAAGGGGYAATDVFDQVEKFAAALAREVDAGANSTRS